VGGALDTTGTSVKNSPTTPILCEYEEV